MKVYDDALIALLIIGVFILCATGLAGEFYVKMEQNRLYQQTYNKNMECRIAFKGRSSNEMNEFCGKIPKLEDFQK